MALQELHTSRSPFEYSKKELLNERAKLENLFNALRGGFVERARQSTAASY
jgi:hypothetical protein